MKKILIACIKKKKKHISPLKGSCCRFYPTCSQYAIMAIEKYGVCKGVLKAILRIIRCNPLNDGGIDYP